MAQHNDTGKDGEEKAALFLLEKGYEILARNYRHQHAEIDIIAQKGKLLVFVEVKTRTNLSFGHPEAFVSREKTRLVMKAAEHYIFAVDWLHDIRFDVLSVAVTNNRTQINHVEDAFY